MLAPGGIDSFPVWRRRRKKSNSTSCPLGTVKMGAQVHLSSDLVALEPAGSARVVDLGVHPAICDRDLQPPRQRRAIPTVDHSHARLS